MARIIVICDEQGDRDLLRSHLVSAGHNVSEVPDGIVALEAFDRQDYDLIVVDLILPEEDGIVVLGLIPRLQPEAKVLAISAGAPDPSSDWAQEIIQMYGGHVILEKPFGRDEFLDKVTALLVQ